MMGESGSAHASAGHHEFLLIPGLGLNADSWAPTLGALGHMAAVVRLPGFGARSRLKEDLRPPALADRFMATAPWPDHPVVLVAHSASSQIAAQVAALAPQRVSTLVLVGPTTSPSSTTWPALGARWLRTALHEDPRQVVGLARQYAHTGLLSMYRAMDAARRDRIELPLAAVTCPTLVVRGPADAICPAGWAATLASTTRCDRSAAVTLRRGAHMVPSTHGDLLALAITGYLDSVA